MFWNAWGFSWVTVYTKIWSIHLYTFGMWLWTPKKWSKQQHTKPYFSPNWPTGPIRFVTMNIFVNEYIHPKYLNTFKYQIVCTRLFWNILAILIFCVFWTHIETFWSINTYFWTFLGNNENSNIFAIINIGRMNIRIYLSE